MRPRQSQGIRGAIRTAVFSLRRWELLEGGLHVYSSFEGTPGGVGDAPLCSSADSPTSGAQVSREWWSYGRLETFPRTLFSII